MKKMVVFTVAALFALLANVSFADTKIGIVDLNKVLINAPQVAKAKKQLQEQFTPRQKAIADAQKKLQEDVKQYEKNNVTMKEVALKEAQKNIMEAQKKWQEMQTSFQKDVMEAQNKSMETILKQVEEIVSDIAKKQQFDLILTKMSTAYSNPKFDITDQVLAALKK